VQVSTPRAYGRWEVEVQASQLAPIRTPADGHRVRVDYARPREVLASDPVVALSDRDGIEFEEIGAVSLTLKGVAEPVVLHSARAVPVS
jgi:hypothetical protein